jgi:hypothetical protein
LRASIFADLDPEVGNPEGPAAPSTMGVRQSTPQGGVDDFLGVPASELFSVLNNLALPAWLLLVFLPRWRTTATLTLVPVFVYAIAYLMFAVYFMTQEKMGLDAFASLAGVAALMSHKLVLLAGPRAAARSQRRAAPSPSFHG